MGWSAVNAIVGAQLFHAIRPSMPGWAGILTIAASTLLVIVHAYERFAWAPRLAVFLVVLGLFARAGDFDAGARMTPASSEPGSGSGPTAAGILSFAAAVFGFATGWCSLAADYTVYLPSRTARGPVFLWTFAGLFLPLCFTELLGAAVATALPAREPYRAAYAEAHVGGLLVHVLIPEGAAGAAVHFGRFCAVVLALSIVAGNCPNSYSVSLSLQAAFGTEAGTGSTKPATTRLRKWLPRVPRFVWVVAATAAYVAVAVAGYAHFEEALENFMLLVGYWLSVYEGVALAEHVGFRRSWGRDRKYGLAGYDPDGYADPARLPPGLAAAAASLLGVVGAALGMAQSWYVGPVARLCGDGTGGSGGDLGFELGFSFAFVSYLGFRTVEKRHFGR